MHKDTTDGEQIVQAELRLLQTNSPTLNGDYNVDIYYLLSENHWSPLPISFKHIDSTPGWKTFDITPFVIKWKQGLVNHGLQVRLTKNKEILSCEGVFSEGEEDPMNTEPLLIVYASDHNTPTTSLKRDTTPQQQEMNSSVDVPYGCHRKEMVVKIDSLKINGVQVVQPTSVDIGVCDGDCSFLQGNQLDYANILDLHYRNTEGSAITAIPSRCCVPTSFRRLPMMIYDERSRRFSLKSAAIVVGKCTCM